MSSREYAEWLAYERVTGTLGPERQDVLTALVLAMLHNQWAKKPKKPKEFLPVWDRGRKKTPEEMLAALRMFNAMSGGEEG